MTSLWNKSVAEMTGEDVERFIQQGIAEGARLDYKQRIDTSLSKNVCSFANTLGGLIIFGIETDAANLPKWPPCGVPRDNWSADRITQICSDAIYPPVLPTVSLPFNNPHSAGTILAVMRVDQSPLAPHAVDQSTKVLVRTNDIGSRFDLADVDRIEHLLERRSRIAQARDSTLSQNIARLERHQPLRGFVPMAWFSISPEYPWQSVCTQTTCLEFITDNEMRRGPFGAIHYYRETEPNNEAIHSVLTSVNANGAIYRGELKHRVAIAQDFRTAAGRVFTPQ
jgi:Putative DNA-binding domain